MAGVDVLAEAFSGANAAFLSEQYARWAVNPASVDPSFADLFDAMDDEARAVHKLADDLATGRWDERHGHLRTQLEFVGSLRLVVSP